MPARAWTLVQPALPGSACSRRIKSKTSFARCGRINTMNPMEPTLLSSGSRVEEYVPTLVRIPAGWFLMGCDTGQDNEKPVHRVWVDEFLLAARQVTNTDYGRFLRDTASPSPPPTFWSDAAFNHPDQPVVGVSWFEAIHHCERLSTNTARKFR